VLLDHLELLIGEGAGLVDQRVRDSDLSDVVEDAAIAQVVDRGLGQVEPTADADGQVGDSKRA